MNKEAKFSELSNKVIGCAIEVHRALGPGLLESAYRQCLCHELRLNNIIHEAQILSYMKLAEIRQGFLINFNVTLLKEGLKSFVLSVLSDIIFSA